MIDPIEDTFSVSCRLSSHFFPITTFFAGLCFRKEPFGDRGTAQELESICILESTSSRVNISFDFFVKSFLVR